MRLTVDPDDIDGCLGLLRAKLGGLGCDRFVTELWVRNHKTGRLPIGLVVGPAEPGWPRDWYLLRCDLCGATWIGEPGEACGWCDRAEARQREAQDRLDRARAERHRGADAA